MVGGHPVDLSQGTHRLKRGAAMLNRVREFRLAGASRRSVYGYVDRSDLLEEANTFDFANPGAPMGKRYETSVPQQALFLMNSPLVIEQVRRVVTRDEFKAQKTAPDHIRYLYELFYQRLPTQEETRLGQGFVRSLMIPASGAAAAASSTNGPAQAQVRVGERTTNGPAPASMGKAPRPLGPWQEYAHALLFANEASFVN
jgi:hypothetical protein